MDQKEIDSLFNQGSISEFNKKQEELIKNLSGKEKREISPLDPFGTVSSESRRGKVIGQLSKVTEESEAGTNMVMGYLENVLSVVSRQQSFIKDILARIKENPGAIHTDEVLSYLNDNNFAIEDLIFSAMDAFQFQDIGRQKLMKVMYTLARLNEYLNELLGGEENREKAFGHQIEKRTLEKDKFKEDVDDIVHSYKVTKSEETPSADATASEPPKPAIKIEPPRPQPPTPPQQQRPQPQSTPVNRPPASTQMPPRPTTQTTPQPQRPQQPPQPIRPQPPSHPTPPPQPKPQPPHVEALSKSTPSVAQSNADVDDIIAEFQGKKKKTDEASGTRLDNSDIDNLIAEFQKKNKPL